MRSLSARLLFSITILLLIFFTITALVLDGVFRGSAEDASASRLEIQRNSLLTVIDLNELNEFTVPDILSEPRFSNPGSGLIAFVAETKRDPDGQLNNTLVWKSQSAIGVIASQPLLAVGKKEIQQVEYMAERYIQSSSAIELETEYFESGVIEQRTLVITVAESLEPYLAQLTRFRTQLFSWFAGLTVILLFLFALLLRSILKPLRRVEDEVAEIDGGKREFLSDDYPSELQGVAVNTNTLIQAERSRLERYRMTLGNLAHSLKTPLAVISATTESDNVDKKLIQEQVQQMNDIVGYQLKRAVTAGSTTLGREPLLLIVNVEALVSVMQKVHYDKGINFAINIKPEVSFYGDKGDLTEMLGNLIDNASKWCQQHVAIQAQQTESNQKRAGLIISIEDDGKGIAEEAKQRILQRGQRADESTPGHGIGLSIVQEIVKSYQGELRIESSLLGGAKFVIILPAI